MKHWLYTLLERLLMKLDKPRFVKCHINLPVTEIQLEKYIPNDGKWHHVESNVSFRIKNDRAVQEATLAIDGEVVTRYALSEVVGRIEP